MADYAGNEAIADPRMSAMPISAAEPKVIATPSKAAESIDPLFESAMAGLHP
jgi:hypothetical protein